MKNNTARNFLISVLLLAIYFGAGYYYFECHSMLDIFKHRKWITYSFYFSLITGTLLFLYSLITHKSWNSFLFIISWLMNLIFTGSIAYNIVEYGTLLIRGKILMYCAAVTILFFLQTILFFSMRMLHRKKLNSISQV